MRLTIRTIAFPVDFSPRSRLAAPYVHAIAARYDAKVLAIHVAEPAENVLHRLGDEALAQPDLQACCLTRHRCRLETFVSRELANLDVERIVEEGSPARCIAGLVQRRSVDCIMIPTQGFAEFRRFLLGSVTARLLHEARCPVWTAAIDEDGQDRPAPIPRHIIAAVTLDDSAASVLTYASELARDCNASLTVAHAASAASPATSHALGVILGKAGIRAATAVRAGDADRVIRAIATERNADLIVIARGAAQEGAGRLRAHSYAIINESPCPVLSI